MQAVPAGSECSVALPSKEADDALLLSHQQDSSHEFSSAASPRSQTMSKWRGPLQPCIAGFKLILWGSKVNYLLIFLPVALASAWFSNSIASFILCLIALVPLANIMGDATDEIAEYTSQTIGGHLWQRCRAHRRHSCTEKWAVAHRANQLARFGTFKFSADPRRFFPCGKLEVPFEHLQC